MKAQDIKLFTMKDDTGDTINLRGPFSYDDGNHIIIEFVQSLKTCRMSLNAAQFDELCYYADQILSEKA